MLTLSRFGALWHQTCFQTLKGDMSGFVVEEQHRDTYILHPFRLAVSLELGGASTSGFQLPLVGVID